MKTIQHRNDQLSVVFFLFGVALLSLLALTYLNAQTMSYDFGTASGIHSSGESTSFLPAPAVGTARVRIGTQGGVAALENPGNPSLGTAGEFRLDAATGSSLNKFSMIDVAGSSAATLRFDCVLSGGAGEWYLFIGEGASYSGNTGFSTAQVFTGIRLIVDSLGGVTLAARNTVGWTTINHPITLNSVLRFDFYCNNRASGEVYDFNGSTSVAARSMDLWINGVIAANDLVKSGLPDSLQMDSFMFYGASSPANASSLRIDDVTWSTGIAAHPLPVELTLFTAERGDGLVELRWETATELNSFGFIIQRREDCDTCSWRDLDLIPGGGTSTAPRQYSWSDEHTSKELTYWYRLRQIDRDGSEETCPAVRVQANEAPSGRNMDPPWPNPARDLTTFTFHVYTPERVRIVLYSSSGSRLYELPLPSLLPAGGHILPFRCADLPRGLYYCVYESNGISEVSALLLI